MYCHNNMGEPSQKRAEIYYYFTLFANISYDQIEVILLYPTYFIINVFTKKEHKIDNLTVYNQSYIMRSYVI